MSGLMGPSADSRACHRETLTWGSPPKGLLYGDCQFWSSGQRHITELQKRPTALLLFRLPCHPTQLPRMRVRDLFHLLAHLLLRFFCSLHMSINCRLHLFHRRALIGREVLHLAEPFFAFL